MNKGNADLRASGFKPEVSGDARAIASDLLKRIEQL